MNVPLSLIRKGGRTKWRRKDRLLLVALTRMEADACSGCGQPVSEAWTGHKEYKVGDQHCAGCERLERETTEPLPGVKRYLIPQDAGAPEGSEFGPVYE